jgi:type VI secretion system protein ImpF
MPELVLAERLQPSLLDRLTDDDPGSPHEAREQRLFDVRRLRASVMRDLAWLLNATDGHAGPALAAYPHVERSTLNFGMPDLAGGTVSRIDATALAARVKEAIVRYEPRILREGLTVTVAAPPEGAGQALLTLRIEGELWATPAPLRLQVDTRFDLESGRVRVADGPAR